MQIAAGGILERQTAEGPEIAVVYRKRYGREWSLPKGKVKPGETWEEAAVREVKEETGCTGVIRRYVGAIDYLVEGSPKVVFYWLMALEAEDDIQDSDEVKKIRWMPPEKAFKRLTHTNQRHILNKVYYLEQILGSAPMSRWRCFWAGVMHSLRWRRLASNIQSYGEELQCIRKLAPSENMVCFEAARKLLDEAKTQLEKGYIERGWKLFHAAKRMALVGLSEDHQRRTHARIMLREADKISGWRKEAIRNVVEFEHDPPPVFDLFKAAVIRDGHYTNNAYKGDMLRAQAVFLFIALSIILCLLLYFLNTVPFALPNIDGVRSAADGYNARPYQILIIIGLFGLLGGTVSAITSVPTSLDSTKIPELTTTFRVTFMRLFMGFASAIVIYLMLRTELAGKIFSDIFSTAKANGIKDPYASYFIAFCAGFSERLVKRAVETVAGK